MRVRIRVNGQEENLRAASVAELLHARGIDGARGLAVALNGAVVPSNEWWNTPLRAGDDIEIVRPFGGG